jgi:pyridoxal phosphate enzyme (YggS family)
VTAAGSMSELAAPIRERLSRVLDRVAESAHKSGRPPGSVRVVTVTKMQPVAVIQAAVEAGATVLGENYAEEAVAKIEAIGALSGIEWHMVGHVQSRKAPLIAQHFAVVHSLDSLKLGERLDRAAQSAGRSLSVLLEVNVSGEGSKYGWPGWDTAQWAEFLPVVAALRKLAKLQVRGLMTMPPLATEPEEARVYFRRLRALRDYLVTQSTGTDWSELSMGTSADYQVAVEEGATLVRIGQAILGPRPTQEAT